MTTTLYTADHEWLRIEGDLATIGVTDYAQSQLGDVVFVELPKIGRSLKKAEAAAVVESVKAASDVYSPVNGQVTASNAALATQPELLNQDPYGAGWLFRVQTTSPLEEASLMSAAEYAKFLADETK